MTQSLRRGRASDANLAASMAAECFKGLPYGYGRSDLVHLVENNGKEIGVGPAAIAHYRFLVIRWTQDRDWSEPGEKPVVFLRVDRTAEERGLSEVRVRQLEYELNEAGLLTWTDRGDYHRSGVRNNEGRIVFAHGVDLSPGAAMLPKLLEIDAGRRDELKERGELRARISRLKGYVKPRLARAIEDGLTDPDNAGWGNGTEMLSAKTNATTPLEQLKETAQQLSSLGDTLSGLVNANALAGEDHDAGCGKARKACGRTRKTIDPYTSQKNLRPINRLLVLRPVDKVPLGAERRTRHAARNHPLKRLTAEKMRVAVGLKAKPRPPGKIVVLEGGGESRPARNATVLALWAMGQTRLLVAREWAD